MCIYVGVDFQSPWMNLQGPVFYMKQLPISPLQPAWGTQYPLQDCASKDEMKLFYF